MGRRQGTSEDRVLEEPRQATGRQRELDAISDQKSLVKAAAGMALPRVCAWTEMGTMSTIRNGVVSAARAESNEEENGKEEDRTARCRDGRIWPPARGGATRFV